MKFQKTDFILSILFLSISLTACTQKMSSHEGQENLAVASSDSCKTTFMQDTTALENNAPDNLHDDLKKAKIIAFFKELLLEHGGAYTLFGSKPITLEPLLDCSEGAYECLQEYLQKNPEVVSIPIERSLEEGWEAWNKQPLRLSDNFILKEINLSDNRMLVFFNVKSTISTLRRHYEVFKKILQSDFDPNEVVQKLYEDTPAIWKKLLLDHEAKGILFGYGIKNAHRFKKMMETTISQNIKASENNDPRLKAECYLHGSPFRIPIFAMLDELESRKLVSNYKKERDKIVEAYSDKNFLEVTLKKLISD